MKTQTEHQSPGFSALGEAQPDNWRLVEASDHLEVQDSETHELICTVDLDDCEIFDSDTNDPAKENARLIVSAPCLERERDALRDALKLTLEALHVATAGRCDTAWTRHVKERSSAALANCEKEVKS